MSVPVDPVPDHDALVITSVENTTGLNASGHPAVTLVWPPRQPDGFTLIVDGTAEVLDRGLRVLPTGAVLHRKPASLSG